MPSNFDLGTKAREFAGELTSLLNKTVCNGVAIVPVRAAGAGDVFKVGYLIKADDFSMYPVPMTLSGRAPSGYLGVAYTLSADLTGQFLMVRSSVLAYSPNADMDHPLMHYDYERDKDLDYPDAHLQVAASAAMWDDACARRNLGSRPMERLHLPVGGRRFRPTLEDLVTFVASEGLADARPGWRERVNEGQERFAETQLRAAIRRRPEVARDAVRQLDAESASGDRP